MQKLTTVSSKNMWQWLNNGLVAPAIYSAHTELQWFLKDTQYVIFTVPLGIYIKSIPTTNQT
jgi:hypothetical protein